MNFYLLLKSLTCTQQSNNNKKSWIILKIISLSKQKKIMYKLMLKNHMSLAGYKHERNKIKNLIRKEKICFNNYCNENKQNS